MRILRFISLLAAFSLGAVSCLEESVDVDQAMDNCVPEGQPVIMYLGFDALDQLDVQVGTKAEAPRVDESRVHDLYVLIFDKDGNKFYGRHFSYEHMVSSLPTLINTYKNYEGWYVDNVTVADVTSTNEAQLADFKLRKSLNLAEDKEGRDVFLAESPYALQMAMEKYPDIEFHFTSEF